ARACDRPVRAVGPSRLGTLGRRAPHVLQRPGLPGLLPSGLFSRGAKLHAPDHTPGGLGECTPLFGVGMIPLSRVSLVIAVYNQLLHTMQCLESILRLPDKAGEIIVVDNASTDGTPEYLKGMDGVTVICNATNLGCAKSWNQGVQASKGDVIGILNNDIVVTSGWLLALLRFMEESGHGIVSPAIREGPLDYELDKYAAEFTAACRMATRPGLLRFCMLFKREVFDRIGLFDEGFIYGGFEEVDFLWRAQKAEITVAVTGSAFI